MTDRRTKAERKILAGEEMARRESDTPCMTWRDVPLLILFLPLALLMGMHVAGLAMLIRKYLRIPYFVTLAFLYVLLVIPAWVWFDTSPWVLIAGTMLVLASSLLPVLFGGREETMEGSNFETSAPSHIVLILLYLFLPALDAAMEARSKLQKRQNHGMHTKHSALSIGNGDPSARAR